MDKREGGGITIFIESFAPPPQMLVSGAVDYVALVDVNLGYKVTVCDARPVFARTRFPKQCFENDE